MKKQTKKIIIASIFLVLALSFITAQVIKDSPELIKQKQDIEKTFLDLWSEQVTIKDIQEVTRIDIFGSLKQLTKQSYIDINTSLFKKVDFENNKRSVYVVNNH